MFVFFVFGPLPVGPAQRSLLIPLNQPATLCPCPAFLGGPLDCLWFPRMFRACAALIVGLA